MAASPDLLAPGVAAFAANKFDGVAESSAKTDTQNVPRATPLAQHLLLDAAAACEPPAKRTRKLHSPAIPAPTPGLPVAATMPPIEGDSEGEGEDDTKLRSIEDLLRAKQQQLMMNSDSDDATAVVIQSAFEDGVGAEAAMKFFNGIKDDPKQCSLMAWYLMIAGLSNQQGPGAEYALALAMELYERDDLELDDIGKQLCLRALLHNSGRCPRFWEEQVLDLLDDLHAAMPEASLAHFNFTLASVTKSCQCLPKFFWTVFDRLQCNGLEPDATTYFCAIQECVGASFIPYVPV